MWCLRRASPLQISPVGVCPLQRLSYPRDYLQPPRASLTSGGPYKSGPWQKDRLRCSSHSDQGVWSNLLRHSPRQCHAPLRWHHLSISHHLGGQLLSTSRWYSHLARPPEGESHLTPPQIKLPLLVVQVHRTMGDLQLEGGEMVVDPSVTPGGCRRRQVHSHRIRRAICPLGQCQVFHHQRHLKEAHLSREVGQGPPIAIPRDWRQNSIVWGGRRTLSMCSGSTTNTMLPPLRRRSG